MWLMTKYFTDVELLEGSRETKIKDSRFIWAPFIYKIYLIFLILLLEGEGEACYGLKKNKTKNTAIPFLGIQPKELKPVI